MKKIKDQFKNEFQSLTLEGDSFYIDDAAERPLALVPYGEPVQEVIPEELGTTVEGESVVVSDGDPEKEVKDVIYGMSKQNTTEGYSLINFSKPSPKPNVFSFENDILRFSGKYSYTYVGWNLLDFFKANVGKTLHFKYKEKDISNALAPTAQLAITNNGKNSYINLFSTSYTIPTDTSNLTKANFGIYSNNTSTDTETSISITEPMLVFEENKDKPYEPYTNGASPNTEYEQDIEIIDGVNRLKVENKILSQSTNVEAVIKNGETTINGTPSNINFNQPFATFTATKTKTYKLITFKSSENSNIRFIYQVNGGSWINGDTYKEISLNKGDILNINLRISTTETISNFIIKLMLIEGTQDLPYLPYGHIGLIQRGKNRLKFKEITTKTSNGLDITSNENGAFKINGTTTGAVAVGFNIEPYKVKGTYRVSGYSKDGLVQLYWKDKNGTVKYKEIRETTPINFEEGDTLFQVFCWTNITGKTYNNETFYLQLEEGSEATPFETPVEPIVHSIDLAGNSIANSNDTIRDLLNIKANGEVSLTKKTIVVNGKDIDAARSTNTSTGGKNRFSYSNNKLIAANTNVNKNGGLSNITSLINSGGTYGGNNGFEIAVNGDTTSLFIYLDELSEMTLEEAKAKLEELGAYFLLPLKEKYYETINLPSIEPIKLFEGTNVFELVTNLGTTMALTYDYVTPSPSIDRPSEILTVQGSYRTNKQNKNMINVKEIKPATSGGITVSYAQNDGLNFVGTANEGSVVNVWFDGGYTIWYNYTDWKSFNKSYIINVLEPNILYIIRDCILFVIYEDGTKETAGGLLNKDHRYKSTKKGYIVAVRAPQVVKDTTYNTVIYPALMRDEMNYIPNKSTTLPLTLTNELLGEIVTLSEEEATALNLDGAGKYRRTDYRRYVFTGDETITKSGHRFVYFISPELIKGSDTADEISSIICNKLIARSPNETYLKNNGISVDADGYIRIYIDEKENYTADEFELLLKEWYDNGEPLEIIYKLATPTYEKITDETELEQLSAYDKQVAFYGINNINTYPTDNLVKAPLGLKVTYDKSNRIL